MNGGPSQVDTWDYKPELAKHAGKPMPTDKKFINSGGRAVGFLAPAVRPFKPGGESGTMVSDFFPRLREHVDKMAVIRSCYTDTHAHGSALVQINTGKPIIGRPSLGSWVTYGLGSVKSELAGLCGDARQTRRADRWSTELVERFYTRFVSRHTCFGHKAIRSWT